MHLTDLALTDFRSHRQVVLRLQTGVTTFTGLNGQGKTNLVEAVAYLATLASHRSATDQALVRQGAGKAVIRARLARGERAALVSLEIVPGKSNTAFIGRTKVKPAEALGITRAVAFVPEDLALVKGPPEGRRRYLDELMTQLRPSMAGTLIDYDRVTKQRAALLKTLAGLSGEKLSHGINGLEVWNGPAAALGGAITAARLTLAAKLRPRVDAVYRKLVGEDTRLTRLDPVDVATGADESDKRETDSSGTVGFDRRSGVGGAPDSGLAELSYQPTVGAVAGDDAAAVEGKLLAAMASGWGREIERGASLYGPHREDLALYLNGLPARGYASHGESWSLALALRLAAFEVIRDELDDDPILILDDVFAELDQGRRRTLTGLIAEVEQVLVTAAVAGDVPTGLTDHWFTVAEGGVSEGE
ncbi:MAG: DNA replication/repair protein RecF [Bifidobacteriaceae bacterium]|jgi:DNA replication and repair protein RecF|nr:DNA replication/repair protein RecF [Bifidobacteriaceae bacterium]